MRTLPVLFGTLLLACGAGCRSNGAAQGDSSSGPSSLMSASLSAAPSLKARMRDHELHGAAARDAIARADLGTAAKEARILADMRIEGIEPTWREKLEAMNSAAARVARAKDLGEASHALAALARTCGDCHAALGRSPPAIGEPPAENGGAAARMQRHQWASTRLWDGLAAPSDEAWRAGARVLSDAPLEPEKLTPGKSPVPKVGSLAATVHDLGRRAESANSGVERGDVYGELMSTCSECHAWLGGGPPAKKQR